MHAAGCGGDRPQIRDIVSQTVLSIYRVCYIRLCQDHEVVIPHMGRLYYLRDPKAMSVPYIVRCGVQSGGGGGILAAEEAPYISGWIHGGGGA